MIKPPKKVSLTINIDKDIVDHLKALALTMSGDTGERGARDGGKNVISKKKVWVSDLIRIALARVYPMGE